MSANNSESIEKIIFWDYGVGALNMLPVETVGQRLVDRWPLIDEAYRAGNITEKDVREVLKRIYAAGEGVIYCESVREYVIKKMIGRYVKNTS